MRKGTTHSSATLSYQDKDSISSNQLQTIFSYLQEHVATASMVSAETGVPQKCITRYKRDLEKVDLLWELEKKDCKQTGFKAWYITTDPAKAPKKPSQLNLFEITIPKPEIKVKYELFERYTEKGAYYEVDQSNGPTKLLKIQPFQWDNRRNLCWPKVFEGNLEDCDKLVANLINTGKP